MLRRCSRNKFNHHHTRCFSAVAQPQPWDTHPTPNPFDHAQRLAKHKDYVSPPDPKPWKTTEPYIDMDKQHHLPRVPKNQIGRRKRDKLLAQPSPLYPQIPGGSALTFQRTVEGRYLVSNQSHDPAIGLIPSFTVDQNKRQSFGMVDDEASYKGIRQGLELVIREAKAPGFSVKGLDGILSISRKFQRLLDQCDLLETPKYAFPLFDEIFFAFQKFGILSDRPYNQMIVQCERREMHSRRYFGCGFLRKFCL